MNPVSVGKHNAPAQFARVRLRYDGVEAASRRLDASERLVVSWRAIGSAPGAFAAASAAADGVHQVDIHRREARPLSPWRTVLTVV